MQDNDNIVLFINKEKECIHLVGLALKLVVDKTSSYHASLVRDIFCKFIAGDFGNVNTSYITKKLWGLKTFA